MKDTKLIIWDLDGVKYPLTAQFQGAYNCALAKAVEKLIPDMKFENALALAEKSYKENNRSMKIFIDQYGLDYFKLGMQAEAEIDLGVLKPSTSFIEKLNQTPVDHMILTEGNPAWVERILTQLQLKEFYANKHLTTLADYPDHTKRYSRYPFELALQKSDYSAQDSLMIEDTSHNLNQPKEMGMTTVLIDASPAAKQTHAIDYIFRDAETFLDYFNSQRSFRP